MAVPLTRKTLLAAKIEAVAGTAESLTASEAAMNVYDAKLEPTGAYVQLPSQTKFGVVPGSTGSRPGKCSFTLQLHGGATLPLWASTLLPACGLAVSTRTFTATSESPGTNVKTVTLGLFEDGNLKMLKGASGNAVFKFVAGEPVTIEFDFTGCWVAPTATAMLSPTFPTEKPIRFASASMLFGAISPYWQPRVKEFTLDLGNKVTLVPSQYDATGYTYACITDRITTGTLDPEAELVSTRAVHALWLAHASTVLAMDLGSTGNAYTLDIASLDWSDAPSPGDRDGIRTETLKFNVCNDGLVMTV